MNQPRRNTWQREAVRAALAEARGFVSAQQLHQTLREDGSTIGLATVYRALSSLAENGDADSIQSPEGENLFRSCATEGHHHHLVCRSCGDTRELEAAVVEEWSRRVGAEHGFAEIEHVVDLFGLCERCRARAAAAS
ncbi:transcriptional repressor [Leucobacter sp. CSA1]|uniref:Transcriptional repressor n=1 Tax=Leucobacter chromiisoli TaxID=2796471 RepID=A0A934Q8U6_9MICO|nr:transcriptional repressor [Leucobacter chromiisoli]MBK0418672.1 transcriptional repressor [Leucobacter chromiisoli]